MTSHAHPREVTGIIHPQRLHRKSDALADIFDTGQVDFDGAQRINDIALARIKKGVGAIGDVLLTHKGTVGRVARVPLDAPRFVCSPQTTFWRSLDVHQLDQSFLFAYLRSPAFSAQLRARMHESDMAPYVSLTAQRSLSVLLPPIAEQRRIARVVDTLDNKLGSNRRLAGVLKQVGATYLAHIRISRAEQMIILGELTLTIRRGITPKYCDDGGILVVNQRCVRSGGIDFAPTRRHDLQQRGVPDERMLSNGDVLVNSTGVGTLGRVAAVRWLPEPATADSHVTIVRPDPGSVEPEYLVWELLNRRDIEALAEGTTGQTELSRTRFAGLPVMLPPPIEQRKFVALAGPLSRQSAALEQEALSLAQARDFLLPGLISGEIRIPDTADPDEVLGPVAEEAAAVAR